jgi:hypothetical protein
MFNDKYNNKYTPRANETEEKVSLKQCVHYLGSKATPICPDYILQSQQWSNVRIRLTYNKMIDIE